MEQPGHIIPGFFHHCPPKKWFPEDTEVTAAPKISREERSSCEATTRRGSWSTCGCPGILECLGKGFKAHPASMGLMGSERLGRISLSAAPCLCQWLTGI